jgi:hypothetical protein
MTRNAALVAHIFVLLAAVAAAPARGQVSWLQLATTTPPPARHYHGMVHDWSRSRVVVFGGWNHGTLFGDTWELAGTSWTQRTVAVSPAARLGPGLAYDSRRGRTVLFGGGVTTLSGSYGDTWEWDGATWTQLFPSVPPLPRVGHGMVYDAARQRTVLFGGVANISTGFNDTWEWDGTVWRRASPPRSPAARQDFAMAYDADRRVTVLFGGQTTTLLGFALGDTWEWDGTTWTARAPAHSPPPRYWAKMAYDVFRRRTVLFGGIDRTSRFGDTWEWDGVDWIQRTPSASPTPAWAPGLAYDIANERIVLFGGYGTAPLNTSWSYGTQQPGLLTAFGSGCPGSSGVPTIGVGFGHRPYIGDAMRVLVSSARPSTPALLCLGGSSTSWSGIPLPLSLALLGAPLCQVLVAIDLTAATATDAGGNGVVELRLPADPALAGRRLFLQWAVADPSANALGLAFTSALDGQIGVP